MSNVNVDKKPRIINKLTIGAVPITGDALAEAATKGTARTAVFSIPLANLRKTGAYKDALADTPGTNLLGQADAAGSAVVGTTTNGGATASASESAGFFFPLPADYVAGGAITVRVRAKVSAAREVAQTVDVVAKKVGDAAVGSDICATAAQALTTAYANYDFTITPTGLVAGDVLQVDVYLATDDTGASADGIPSIVALSVRPTVTT